MEVKINLIVSDILMIDLAVLEGLKGNEDLRQHGLDSITSVDLIIGLENGFDITVSDEDLLIENVCTLDNIKKLIYNYSQRF